jgi:alginate O-acetyltransferase complex protein AlgI
MTFTSWTFFVFLACVLTAYFSLRQRWRWQNIVLLVASYIFYGYWDWRFLALLFGMTLVNYFAGWMISRQPEGGAGKSKKRPWLVSAIVIDILVLGAFKYLNFFAQSLTGILHTIGIHLDPFTLSIILPLGISFFTFMAITYPFDIYRGRIQHTKNFPDFALFVSFFPTIVSGPVERASHMLPQFQAPRKVTSDTFNEAIWLIAWGLFQKLVIADNLGVIVNQVFNNYTQYQGLDIVIAVVAYTVQILADFGGYTDIARGIARLFGFQLLLNFNVPYFALNPADFWSRWHISLSQWFRDYVYIPLGGNRKGKWRANLNVFVTMVLVGLWHGPALTFVIWGAWHGLLQVIYRLLGRTMQSTDRAVSGLLSFFSVTGRTALMIVLVAAGWAAFRSTSLSQLAYVFSHIGLGTSDATLSSSWQLFLFTIPLVIIQIFQIKTASQVYMARLNPWTRGLAYGVIIVGILIFSQREIPRFIYQGF